MILEKTADGWTEKEARRRGHTWKRVKRQVLNDDVDYDVGVLEPEAWVDVGGDF